MTTEHTAYQLARLAGLDSDPDSPTSPGAQWLQRVADTAAEIRDEDEPGEARTDRITESADSLVPVYTHERWKVFVDLAAYTEEVSELTEDVRDLTACAGVALYLIAERLLYALLDDDDQEDDDEAGTP